VARLDFERPDLARFPCLALAWESLRAGGTATAALNAANEVAVAAFLARAVPYTGIARIVAETLAGVPNLAADTLEQVLAADAAAREFAAGIARRWAA
jgi:1-deoxy-D-xylulose-5-phosphate reductoisomerase